MTLSRREFVKKGSLSLSFALAGSHILLSPAEAHAREIPFTVLNADEILTLESTCEILLPGGTESGVAHFVDHQLGVDPNDSLLVLKYFGFPPPYTEFYRPVLAALKELSQTMFGLDIQSLDEKQGRQFIEAIRDKNPPAWKAPPAPLAYIALRNDTVDVVYGTPEGFKKLGVPYMEHILPPEGWS